MRVCLAFRAQSEFLDEPGFVERVITSSFERGAARLQTRKPREMRTEKLTSVELILRHSLRRDTTDGEVIRVDCIGVFFIRE